MSKEPQKYDVVSSAFSGQMKGLLDFIEWGRKEILKPDKPEAPTLSRNIEDEAGLWEDKKDNQ